MEINSPHFTLPRNPDGSVSKETMDAVEQYVRSLFDTAIDEMKARIHKMPTAPGHISVFKVELTIKLQNKLD